MSCGTTHCRNVILQPRAIRPPGIPPTPPGEVQNLFVFTPRQSNSGRATITFFSPNGSAAGTLNYVITLSGGPYVLGEIQITES